MFKESDGKISSKRVWGSIILFISLAQSIGAGFEVYDPIEGVLTMQFITGCGVLGISVLKK